MLCPGVVVAESGALRHISWRWPSRLPAVGARRASAGPQRGYHISEKRTYQPDHKGQLAPASVRQQGTALAAHIEHEEGENA
jgi:hypothetical protein